MPGCGEQGGDLASCLCVPGCSRALGGLPRDLTVAVPAHGSSRTCLCPVLLSREPGWSYGQPAHRVSCATLKNPAGQGPCGGDAVLLRLEARGPGPRPVGCAPSGTPRASSRGPQAMVRARDRRHTIASVRGDPHCRAPSGSSVTHGCAQHQHQLLKSPGNSQVFTRDDPKLLIHPVPPAQRQPPCGSRRPAFPRLPKPSPDCPGHNAGDRWGFLPRRAIAFLR